MAQDKPIPELQLALLEKHDGSFEISALINECEYCGSMTMGARHITNHQAEELKKLFKMEPFPPTLPKYRFIWQEPSELRSKGLENPLYH